MKKAIKIIIIVLAVLCALSVYPILHFKDISDVNQTMSVNITADADCFGATAVIAAGESSVVSYIVENPTYTEAHVRETVVLSVYRADGTPLPLNGTSSALSAYDLVGTDGTPISGKLVQDNQAVYVFEEYTLGAAKHRYPLLSQEESEHPNAQTATHTLSMDKNAAEPYKNCIVRVDIIVESSADGDAWEVTSTLTGYLANSEGADISVLSGEAVIPEIVSPVSFEWSLEDGTAFLIGLGTVTDADIFIPYEIRLNADGKEDPKGEVYPVTVKSNAFANCTELTSVTFADGVTVENNSMSSTFYGCTSLTEVYNIPDSVTVMNNTFAGCTALVTAPELPYGVTDMSFCFADCTALTTVGALPNSVTSLALCFSNCTSLVTPPVLPPSIESLSGTFSGCTALSAAPEIPDGVTNMKNTFANCISLVTAPELPNSVMELTACFRGCTSLDGSVTIPNAIIIDYIYNLHETSPFYRTFDGCTSLDSIYIDFCPSIFDRSNISEEFPVYYLQSHTPKGLCEHCQTISDTVIIDGLSVEFKRIDASRYDDYVHAVESVPDFLKPSCHKLVFCDILPTGCEGGLAVYNGYTRTAYVSFDYNENDKWNPVDTIIHELAHCYDFKYGLSSSSTWQTLHWQEGKICGRWYYLGEKTPAIENFAVATTLYLLSPETLQENCPGMYSYMDNLFGNLE